MKSNALHRARVLGTLMLAGVAAGAAACSGSNGEDVTSRSDRETAGPSVPADPAPSGGPGGAGSSAAGPASEAAAAEPEASKVRLAFDGLARLEGGFTYEGWAIIAGVPVSTGKFNVAGEGSGIVREDGSPIPQGLFTVGPELGKATAFVLSIEPAGDADPGPSTTHIVAGTFAGGAATLATAHPAALGADLGMGASAASGSFLLATPTDGMMTNERSGVWFLAMGTSGPEPALTIPKLPSGWVYEGWAVIGGVPVSTGRFTSAASADSAGTFSGDQPAPPFPGEDFLRNAPDPLCFPLDLRGADVVVTVEPQPDDSPRPFALRTLAATVPAAAMEGKSIPLVNRAATFAKGTAALE